MADTVQIGDLVQALSHARATFAGQVGTGSTTTVINLEGLDLGSESLVGNFVLLDAGALGAGSTPQVASITANTDKSITVGALPIAPATGANIWIYQVATINANVSENLQQWAGTNLAAPQGDADGVAPLSSGLPVFLAHLVGWSGSAWNRLKVLASGALQVRDDATGSTGTAAPTVAILSGGSDGTDLRPVLTDPTGRQITGSGPTLANYVPSGTAAAVTTPLLLTYGNVKSPYAVTHEGTINLAVAISAASQVSISHNASSGSPSYNTLNGGQSLAAGSEYAYSIPVKSGDSIDLELSAAATVNVLDLHFVASQ